LSSRRVVCRFLVVDALLIWEDKLSCWIKPLTAAEMYVTYYLATMNHFCFSTPFLLMIFAKLLNPNSLWSKNCCVFFEAFCACVWLVALFDGLKKIDEEFLVWS